MYWLCTYRWCDKTHPSCQHHPQSAKFHYWNWFSRRPHHGVSISWLVHTLICVPRWPIACMHAHLCFSRGRARAPKDHHPSHLLESQWCDHGFCHPGSDLCTCVQCADLCLVEEEVTACDSVAECCCNMLYNSDSGVCGVTMNMFTGTCQILVCYTVFCSCCTISYPQPLFILSSIISHWWSKNTYISAFSFPIQVTTFPLPNSLLHQH